MRSTLFDRFESDDPPSVDQLASDLADTLSGRRAFASRMLGVLCWGMPAMNDITSKSRSDREKVARYITETLVRFEPRLERLRVTPIVDAADYAFRIEAQIVERETSSVTLRILSPLVGGGLGTNVVVLDVRDETE